MSGASCADLRWDPALVEWLAGGERGMSSNAIVQHLTGLPTTRDWLSEPCDPADFRRCELLLRAVPGLQKALPHMAEVSPAWAALVERWDEIVSLFESEVPSAFTRDIRYGRAPKTGALIRSCRVDVEAL